MTTQSQHSEQDAGEASSLSPLGQAALAYAEQGIPVFPCEPGDKVPLFRQGAAEATSDPDQIRTWWAEYPDANIGGQMSGMVVIDVSPAGEPDAAERLAKERTLVHRSPRGSTHYLFRTGEEFQDRAEPWPGIRVRCGKGYVLLPTSLIEGVGEYVAICAAEPTPLPEWLAEQLRGASAPELSTDDPLSYEAWMRVPDAPMVVDKLVPSEKLAIVWGDTGCGKTYLLAELATAIAWRRPAFGSYPVNLPRRGGVVVIFAGEDAKELVKSRLQALSVKHNRSLEGRVYVAGVALPVDDDEKLEYLRKKVREIQADSGRRIDAIFNDTLGRSLGSKSPNDAEVAQYFSVVMEGLVKEFGCPVICTAHKPKSGETIAGSQIFVNNAPVTIHVEGEFNRDHQLTGFACTFEPKYRIGPTPPRFAVAAETVSLPHSVNGSATDIVFHLTEVGAADAEEAGESRAAQRECATCLEVLKAAGAAGLVRSAWEAACVSQGIKKGNFRYRMEWLVENGLVLKPEKQRQPYRVAEGAQEWKPRGRKVGDL
jgi:hypothetical protein